MCKIDRNNVSCDDGDDRSDPDEACIHDADFDPVQAGAKTAGKEAPLACVSHTIHAPSLDL